MVRGCVQEPLCQHFKITSQAAAKLVKKDEGERRMNLVDGSWKEISILGDTVDVIDQVTPGSGILGVRDWLDMILGGEDAYRVDRLLLTCWKTKEKQQGGWAHNINQAELVDQWRPLARRSRKWTCVLKPWEGVVGNITDMKVMFHQNT
jgi:hypothetical protein